MSEKRRVYIAGGLTPRGHNSANPAIDYLMNVSSMVRWSIDVLLAGYAPFCPALDMLFFLLLRPGERITEPMIKRFSKDWLEVSDVVFMTQGWQRSPGSVKEKELAEKLGIPVVYSLTELKELDNERDEV